MESKKQELIRFIRWLGENPSFYYFTISDVGISTDEAIELIKSLLEQQFYILIPVVLGQAHSLELDNLLHKLCLDKLCDAWSNSSMENIIAEVEELLTKREVRNESAGKGDCSNFNWAWKKIGRIDEHDRR